MGVVHHCIQTLLRVAGAQHVSTEAFTLMLCLHPQLVSLTHYVVLQSVWGHATRLATYPRETSQAQGRCPTTVTNSKCRHWTCETHEFAKLGPQGSQMRRWCRDQESTESMSPQPSSSGCRRAPHRKCREGARLQIGPPCSTPYRDWQEGSHRHLRQLEARPLRHHPRRCLIIIYRYVKTSH